MCVCVCVCVCACALVQVCVCAFGCCFVSANGLLVDVCQCCCLLMFVCLPLSRHFPCCKTWWIKNLNLYLNLTCFKWNVTCFESNVRNATCFQSAEMPSVLSQLKMRKCLNRIVRKTSTNSVSSDSWGCVTSNCDKRNRQIFITRQTAILTTSLSLTLIAFSRLLVCLIFCWYVCASFVLCCCYRSALTCSIQVHSPVSGRLPRAAWRWWYDRWGRGRTVWCRPPSPHTSGRTCGNTAAAWDSGTAPYTRCMSTRPLPSSSAPSRRSLRRLPPSDSPSWIVRAVW